MSFADEKRGIEDYFKRGMHAGYAHVLDIALTIDATNATVTRESGSFITDGVSVGDFISLIDFVNLSNNSTFEVASVSSLSLVLNDPAGLLVDEIGTITSIAFPAIPIEYENVSFEPKDKNQVFVTCYLVEGDGSQITLGTKPYFRYVGFVQNSIYGPTGVGTDDAKSLADRIAGIWRNKQFSYGSSGMFCFYAPTLTPLDYQTRARLGVRAGKLRTDVSTPYHRDIQY